MNIINGIYGRRKGIGNWSDLAPILKGINIFPLPENDKVYHDCSTKCLGCPYPRHGLMCHDDRPDGSCLRTDMQELDAKHQREYLQREESASTIRAESLVLVDMAFAAANE